MSTLAGAPQPDVEDEALLHEALLQFLYMAPIGLTQTSIDGEIVLINPLCAELLMPLLRGGEMQNLFTALSSVAPDLAHRARAFAPAHGKICEGLEIHVSGGMAGSKEPQILGLTLLKLDDNRLMAVLNDITQVVQRERELRHTQAWIQSISTGMLDVSYALLSLDSAGRVRGWNPGIRNLTGFEAEATVGRSYADFYPGGDLDGTRAAERLQEADQTGWSLEEGWVNRTDGERFWASCLIAPVALPLVDSSGNAGRMYSLVIRDISERREANEALRRSIWSDHLTGLANRRAFFDAAATATQRCTRSRLPLSLVLFDADNFKAVNDTHGHAAGDAVLRHLAAGLLVTFGPTDIVARFGGEEFVVLLPGSTAQKAHSVAERFRAHMASHPVTVDGVSVACTVSAGVATSGEGIAGIDALLQRADTALYAAKGSGRDQVVCWDETLLVRGGAVTTRVLP